MAIKHFIFDMGNVFLDYDPERIMRAIVGSEERFDEVMAVTTHAPEWQKLDEGCITQEEAVASMTAKAPHLKAEIEAVMARWDEALLPVPGMLELVTRIKAHGYGLHLLSNASLRFRSYQHRFPVFALMDSIHVSAEMKMLKPNPEIYETLLQDQKLKANECLFIDDLPQNIQGAESVGLNAYQFTTKEAFETFLAQNCLL